MDMRFSGLYLLLITLSIPYFSHAQSTDTGVPLWPIYYQSDDGQHVEVAASLYGRRGDNRHLGPVFWDKDSTTVFLLLAEPEGMGSSAACVEYRRAQGRRPGALGGGLFGRAAAAVVEGR